MCQRPISPEPWHYPGLTPTVPPAQTTNPTTPQRGGIGRHPVRGRRSKRRSVPRHLRSEGTSTPTDRQSRTTPQRGGIGRHPVRGRRSKRRSMPRHLRSEGTSTPTDRQSRTTPQRGGIGRHPVRGRRSKRRSVPRHLRSEGTSTRSDSPPNQHSAPTLHPIRTPSRQAYRCEGAVPSDEASLGT